MKLIDLIKSFIHSSGSQECSHETGRDKQWIVDGKPVIGAYCRKCGTFIPKNKKVKKS